MADQVIFRTTEQKKRLARILAARAGYENTSDYFNALLDREIERLTPDELAMLLGDHASPKATRQPYGEQDKRRK